MKFPASPIVFLGVLASAAHGANAVALHPRLILTPARVTALRASDTPRQRELGRLARENADQMSSATIPTMREANNRYRSFGDTLPALGLAFQLTGDRRYVDAAERWLQAFLAVPQWKGSQNLGRSAWVVGSALTYDWLHAELSAAIRAEVRARLLAEGDILLRETSYWRLLSNHCLIETSALGMIGLALQDEDPRARAFLEKARERAELIIEHAPDDGTWGEGIQYWQYGLGYFLRFLEASKTAGDRDYYPRYAWLQKTGLFPIQFSLPGRPADTVNFGDSGSHDYVAGFLMYLPAAVYRNGFYQDYGNRTRATRPSKLSWMDFIAYDPSIAPTDFTTLPRFQHFADNGFVIMRSGWSEGDSLLAFHCGPAPGHRNQVDPRRLERRGFGPGHAHPDINSFSFYAHGQWLAFDPGYVHEKWARDHNTVLVNGRGQAGEGSEWLDYMAFESREPVPTILRAETSVGFDYVIGDAGNIYVDEAGLGHFRRHLLFLRPDIVVVLDDLAGKQPSRFDWLLQAPERARETAKGEFEAVTGGVRLWMRPILPAGLTSKIETRPLRGSATDGTVTTIDLRTAQVERTEILVVLCALPDAAARPPAVKFEHGRLSLGHRGKSWEIGVLPPTADPAARLLRVNAP